MAKLGKEERQRISEAMKRAHAEKKKAGLPWAQKKAPARRASPSGGIDGILKRIDARISELQDLRRTLIKHGGVL